MPKLSLQTPQLAPSQWTEEDFQAFVAWLKQTVIGLNKTFPTALGQCLLHNSTTQSIINATATTVTYDTTDLDNQGMNSGGGIVTIPNGADGLYIVSFQTAWQASGAGTFRFAVLQRNAANYKALDMRPPVSGGSNQTTSNFSTSVSLSGGDQLLVQVEQDSGGSLTVGGSTSYQQSQFSVVGPLL